MHPATELIRRTGELFESISLINGGVSIREAIVIDNYGSMAERKEARSKDELTDWGRLVGTDDLKRHVDAGGLVLCRCKRIAVLFASVFILDSIIGQSR